MTKVYSINEEVGTNAVIHFVSVQLIWLSYDHLSR